MWWEFDGHFSDNPMITSIPLQVSYITHTEELLMNSKARAHQILRSIVCQGFILSFAALLVVSGANVAAQGLVPEALPSNITVRSQADSVSVFIDSVFYGVSPCKIVLSGPARKVLRLQKGGYVPLRDTLEVPAGRDTTLFLRMTKMGIVRIQSQPDSARVYQNGAPAGTTPLVLSGTPGDSLILMLAKPGFQDWETVAILAEDRPGEVIARLNRNEASVSVYVDNPHMSVLLDGRPISKGPITDYLSSIGSHRLAVRNDSTGQEKEIVATLPEARRYFFRAGFGVFSVDRLLLAFLLPGSLEIADGEYIKGAALLIGNVALGYLAVRSQAEYSDRLDEYNTSAWRYLAASNETEATRWRQDLLARKSELDKSYARRTVTIGLFAAAYCYGLIDALLHHLTGDVLELVPLRNIEGLPFPSAKGAQVQIRF